MSGRCTFIDEVVTQPLAGGVMRFEAKTGGDVQFFGMERSTALKVAYDILHEVEADEMRKLGVVVPFGRTG